MKTKILFINGHLNYGGVEKSLVDILNNIDYEQYSVDLLLLEGLGDYANFIPKNVNIILYDLHNTYGNLFSVMFSCLKKRDFLSILIKLVFLISNFFGIRMISLLKPIILSKKHYDVVIGFRPGASTDFATWLFNTEKRLIWWHNGEINLNTNQKRNYIDDCNNIDYIVTVSEGCKSMLAKELEINENKIMVIPNMIDSYEIVKLSNEYVPFELINNKLKIISVGRLSEEKHFDNCIITANMLRKNGYNFQWTVIGEGIERKKLEQLIDKYQLQEYILLLGKKTNPYPYMCNADIYVHTSYVESQSLTILESMILGIPCVITDSLGPRGYCKNQYNCIYVNHEEDALFKGIEQVVKLNQTKELEEIKINAKNTALNFNSKEIMNLFYSLINN